jgi:hypothetical protein
VVDRRQHFMMLGVSSVAAIGYTLALIYTVVNGGK